MIVFELEGFKTRFKVNFLMIILLSKTPSMAKLILSPNEI